MAKIDLKSLKVGAEKEIKSTQDLKGLDQFFRKYLGRKGELTRILHSLKKLPKERRIKVGKEANELKNFIKIEFDKRVQILKEKARQRVEEKEWIDVTASGKKPTLGHLHPLTLVKRRIEEIFRGMGFFVVEGPEIETEWHNFDALNIPKDHPARDVWDTFFLKDGGVLRTHTSPIQIRYMEKHSPPLRIIAPGRVFRHEATDPSHEFEFWQAEGLMVDKNVSVANFKAIIETFLKEFFEKKEIKTRLRPAYFPFTEPSFELEIQCIMCKGKGCSVCKNTGWLEIIPGGMVHPNVFKNAGLNPKFWQGFAFGAGIDRLAMIKYKIDDIRLFNSGDLRFLEQF